MESDVRLAERPKLALSVARGLKGAVVSAAVAVALVTSAAAFELTYRWVTSRAPAFQRDANVWAACEEWLVPVIGCAVVAGCAGWATFAPVRRSRFAGTLAVVFLGSVPLWTVLGSLQFTPPRIKSVDHPLLYPSEFVFLVGPPIIVSAPLTARRVRRNTRAHAG